MSGDDLTIYLFLWGSAFAFGLGAIAMFDSAHVTIRRILWSVSGVFLLLALSWPLIATKWPQAQEAALNIRGSQIGLDIIGLSIFVLLVWDFRARQRWLLKGDTRSGTDLLNTKIEQANRDILHLLHFAVYQSTIQMLERLLMVAPVDGIDSPLELGSSFPLDNETEKEFVALVRRTLYPGSHRRSTFETVMQNAEAAAEHEIEQIPMNRRPQEIDPLAIRKWAITHRQCTRAVAFLEHEKRVAEESLLGQRHNLLELYSEKNK